MGLALGRIDGVGGAGVLEPLSDPALPLAKRQDLLRRLLAGARIVALNRRAGTMLGIAQSDLPVPVNAIWPFGQGDLLRQSLAAAEEPGACFQARLGLKSTNGIVHVRYSSWHEDEAEPGTVTFGLDDVSDQVSAEQGLVHLRGQMAHADRLSTLGVLTATIAHEVRQPLSAMTTSAHAGRRWLQHPVPDLDQVARCLDTIVLAADKAEETVVRLGAMASNRHEPRMPCSVRAMIEETADFLRQELSSRQAALLLDISDEAGLVHADGIQLRQVLINLMMNAAQAMAEARCWSRTLTVRARKSEDSVTIDVEDTGPGISAADRERLFDGFRSTKASGLGLGLRICRQIVEDHGGTLEHISKATAGSIFRFSLPRAA